MNTKKVLKNKRNENYLWYISNYSCNDSCALCNLYTGRYNRSRRRNRGSSAVQMASDVNSQNVGKEKKQIFLHIARKKKKLLHCPGPNRRWWLSFLKNLEFIQGLQKIA